MKKNAIITVLCLIVAAIIVVTLVLFVKTLDKPTATPDNEQTENSIETEIGNTQTTPEPDIGESDNTNDTQADTPSDNINDNPDDSVSNNNETDNSSNDNEANTEDGSQGSGEVSQPSSPVVEDPKPVVIPENISESYKDFSLTKGMDAKTAYEYLNSFLSSKYSILTNKQNKVSSDYAPTDLVVPSGCQYQMERVAANALVELLSAAKQNGIYDLVLYSGYRTYASQKNKYETRTNKYLNQGYSQAEAEAKAGEYIAPPGASEHHTGLAADVCSSAIVNKYGYLSDDFDSTKEYQWMKNNCAQYGFIVRYQKGKEGITGYSYEPWHIRYLGKDHAIACTALGLTYEEYHALLIKYRDQAKAEAGV